MVLRIVLVLAAIALASSLMPYGRVAAERGWPCGVIHSTDKPVLIGLSIIAASIGVIVANIVHQDASWWIIALVPAVWFFLPPIVLNVLKSWTTLVAIVGAPVLLLASLFVP
jgi:hypothetical protein